MIIDEQVVSADATKAVTCPSNEEDYAPCYCYDYNDQGQFLGLYCSNLHLNDTTIDRVLATFTDDNNSSSNPLIHIDLTMNQLTIIPARLKLLDQLDFADLRFNRIHSLGSNAFDSHHHSSDAAATDANQLQLILQGNDLSVIEPGAFQDLVLL